MQTKPVHIGLSLQATEPLPVTFYVSPEVLADPGITDEYLADLLRDYLVTAITFHRKAFKQEDALTQATQ